MGDLSPAPKIGTLGVIAGGASGALGVPFAQTIFLINVRVAGTGYVDNIAEIAAELNVDDRVSLFREPKNEIDPLAIVVKDGQNRKIGYVPRADNAILARLLDAGKRIFGKIRRKERVKNWFKIEIDIFLDD